MSDDEEVPPVGAGMEDDDMSDGNGDGGYNPPSELPEGISKQVLTPAGADCWKKPKAGDEVTVHYVGTLAADGSEFDSSRARDEPFVFTLGKGQVIKGWDLGVVTMKKGELAKFTLAPEYAYGDAGSPPKIPEKATLIFEVELISWASKDDLFGDEGVIKTQIKEGSGWTTPKNGEEVLLSLKAEAADGSLVEERTDLAYVLGSDTLGPIAKACDKALQGMKKGEEATLKCTKDYAYGDRNPDGATISLELKELYETKDVSFAKDKSMMKKQVKQGEGYDTPKDGARVKLSVEAATDGAVPLPGFAPGGLDFVAGNGEVCDALECAAAEMKKGERAVLTVSAPGTAAEARIGLKELAAAKVVLTLELSDFEKAKDTWSMSEEEKLEFGTARKEVGSNLFKGGRLMMALGRYKKVCELFSYVDSMKEENKTKAKELKKASELNKAACYLKLQDHIEAKKSCDAVLKEDAQNVKAVYRRAQAEFGLRNFTECIRDCKKVVEVDPQNKEVRTLLKQAQAGQREDDRKSKGMFLNMCKALGKGPIPEPHKDKKSFGDDDVDNDLVDGDAPMGDGDADGDAGGDPVGDVAASGGGDAKADEAPASEPEKDAEMARVGGS